MLLNPRLRCRLVRFRRHFKFELDRKWRYGRGERPLYYNSHRPDAMGLLIKRELAAFADHQHIAEM